MPYAESKLKFIHHETGEQSHCGNVLQIHQSSEGLGWQGIIMEKGMSPHFYPKNVSTPYFYFAMAIERDLNWEAEQDGRMKALKTLPGEIWINPPHSPFSHVIDEPCYFIILAVDEILFLDSASLPLKGKALKFLNNYNVNDPSLRSFLELFYIEVESQRKSGMPYIRALLNSLSTYYVQNFSNYLDLAHPEAFSSQKLPMEKIESFIENTLTQNITVEALAEEFRFSKYYFLREFKKIRGETPYQYILGRRLQRAKELLQDKKQTIGSITYDLNFTDQSHFTRSFKSRFGLTPGDYRKNLLKSS